jgi:hypothetical protein
MRATAAVGDGATLQPGVDDRRDSALAQLRYRITNTRISVMRVVGVLGDALAGLSVIGAVTA